MNDSPTIYPPVYGWMRELSRHYFAGFRALAECWPAPVHVVAGVRMTPVRQALGWTPPETGRVHIHIPSEAPDPAAAMDAVWRDADAADAIHVVQSARGDGLVDEAWKRLAARPKARSAFVAEMVSTVGGPWRNLKRSLYYRVAARGRLARDARYYFAVGRLGEEYFARRGFPRQRIRPFIYTLDAPPSSKIDDTPASSASFVSTAEAGAEPAAGPLRLLFVGRGAPVKRADLIVEALGRLPAGSWRLTLAGPVAGEWGYDQFTKLGDGPEVRRLPAQSFAAVQRLYDEHDLLLLPSDWDGWGMVTQEALARGVAAVVSERVGSRDLVEDFGAGAVIPAGDAGALAGVLRAALADPGLLASWRRGALGHRDCLSAEVTGGYFRDLLRHCFLEPEGSPPPAPPWRVRGG